MSAAKLSTSAFTHVGLLMFHSANMMGVVSNSVHDIIYVVLGGFKADGNAVGLYQTKYLEMKTTTNVGYN